MISDKIQLMINLIIYTTCYANRADITLHQSAKKYFDALGLKKLPSINSLREEWGELKKERRPLSTGYKAVKKKYIDLGTAKVNADVILFGTRTTQQKMLNRDAR